VLPTSDEPSCYKAAQREHRKNECAKQPRNANREGHLTLPKDGGAKN
jgi:hypothetical protein